MLSVRYRVVNKKTEKTWSLLSWNIQSAQTCTVKLGHNKSSQQTGSQCDHNSGSHVTGIRRWRLSTSQSFFNRLFPNASYIRHSARYTGRHGRMNGTPVLSSMKPIVVSDV